MPSGSKKPAGGYHAGPKGSYGCDGYPTVSSDGTVHGCHPTKAKAQAQARAIWASVNTKKKIEIKDLEKATFVEGDFVIASCEDEVHVGRVEYVMTNGSSGLPGSEYYLETSIDNPALVIRTLEFDSDGQYWKETMYLISIPATDATKIASLPLDTEAVMIDGQIMSDPETMPNMGKAKNPCWEGYVQRGMKEKDGKMVPNCVPVEKSDMPCCPDENNIDKREFSTTSRERMAESGTAMPDGSFPIANRSDLRNAIQSVGRAKDYAKAKAHIIRRARALNAMDMLPEDWRNKATKGMGHWSGSIFDLNPFVK